MGSLLSYHACMHQYYVSQFHATKPNPGQQYTAAQHMFQFILYRKDKKISPFFIFPPSFRIPSKTQIYCFSDSQSPNQRRHYLSKHFNQYSWHANKQRKLYKFLRLLSSSLSPKHSISSSQTKSFYTIWMLSVYILGKFNVWAVDM